MKFLQISPSLTLSQLRDIVGSSNLQQVLAMNSLPVVPNIGQYVTSRIQSIAQDDISVSLSSKQMALDRASSDSDVFEAMALMDDYSWKIYQETNALPGTLLVPDDLILAKSQNVLGNSSRVSKDIYGEVIYAISNPPYVVESEVFNSYYTNKSAQVADVTSRNLDNLFQNFKIPWGSMSIYSSLSDDSKDFPVYPESMNNTAKANYTTMPEIIYQYEPWQLYTSSGPRVVTYDFEFHRDMWTGDHRDGKANELIRFCMANCYPEYNGSAVNTSLVTLYMNGETLIRGVLTDVNVSWSGPLGLDNFYLVCKLSLSITEVSEYPLNYWSVMQKPLIG